MSSLNRSRERLGGEDAAWLHMEDPANPMIVNAIVELESRLPMERVMALLERLVIELPRFRMRIIEPRYGAGLPSWQLASDFALERHVEHVDLPERPTGGSEGRSGGAGATSDGRDSNGNGSARDTTREAARDVRRDDPLRTFVGRAVSSLLDIRYPLWHVYVIDRAHRGTTLLFRVHHAVADGFALLHVLMAACSPDERGTRSASTMPKSTHVAGRQSGVLDVARAALRLVLLPHDPNTILKDTLGLEKHVAWSRAIPLADVKSAARRLSASVNDVLVSTVAGALARYFRRHGQAPAYEIHAMVPVNLRTVSPSAALGNQFGLVVLGLPIGIDDPLARASAVRDRMQMLKRAPEAGVAHVMLRMMGHAPRPIEDLAVAFFGKKASLVLTNVPGPTERVKLDGVPVQRMMFWVPQSGRMGLGISIFSYAGEVTIGVLADANIIADPDALAEDLHAELDGLYLHLSGLEQSRRGSKTWTPSDSV